MPNKITYQGKEFFVIGSAVADIAIAETEDKQLKGVFDVAQERLLDGPFDPEWRVYLQFNKVNNLISHSTKPGHDDRYVVVKGDTEPT